MISRTQRRPQMTVEEFEELERHAPETVRLEFINGQVVVKPMADGNDREMIAWLQRVCMQHRPDLWLHAESGLKTERYRKGALAPTECSSGWVGSRAKGSGRKRTAP